MAKKEPPGFNTPFRALKAPARRALAAVPGAAAVSSPSSKLPPVSQAPPAPSERSGDTDDDRLFEQAMRGVTPLAASERSRRASPLAPPATPPSRATLRARAQRDEALADAELVELVSRPGRLTIEKHGETVVGFSDGLDRRLLRRLGGGEFPIDAELDLHGLTRVTAAAALEKAVKRARADGQRCLLVIHGRGLNSGEEGPVLKSTVVESLAAGALGRMVLAFSSAPLALGGPGATLVLLRKTTG